MRAWIVTQVELEIVLIVKDDFAGIVLFAGLGGIVDEIDARFPGGGRWDFRARIQDREHFFLELFRIDSGAQECFSGRFQLH